MLAYQKLCFNHFKTVTVHTNAVMKYMPIPVVTAIGHIKPERCEVQLLWLTWPGLILESCTNSAAGDSPEFQDKDYHRNLS